MTLAIDDSRGEAVGEEVAEADVSLIEQLRVAAVQSLDSRREPDARGMENEVIVRRHQAERLDDPVVTLDADADMCEEHPPVCIVPDDGAAVDPARHHMEVPVWK